jgi:hypothetical protein
LHSAHTGRANIFLATSFWQESRVQKRVKNPKEVRQLSIVSSVVSGYSRVTSIFKEPNEVFPVDSGSVPWCRVKANCKVRSSFEGAVASASWIRPDHARREREERREEMEKKMRGSLYSEKGKKTERKELTLRVLLLLSHISTFTTFKGFHGDKLAQFMVRCSRQCLSSETNSVPISNTCYLRALTDSPEW